MECLAILYDNEQINNLLPIFAFRPKNVVLLYDYKYTPVKNLEYIKNVCMLRFPDIIIEYKGYDGLSIENITKTCTSVIHKKTSCFFNITGAGEFGAIGAYQACRKTFTPIFKLDVLGEKLINVFGCKSLEKNFVMPKLNIENIFALHGACITGYNHASPSSEIFDNILIFCNAVFDDLELWKKMCLYLQTGNTNFSQGYNNLFFNAPQHIYKGNSSISLTNFKLLELAQKLKFIYKLNTSSNKISFYYRDKKIKSYLSDFGIWLELFCYINLKREKIFHDVRLSVKFEWNNNKRKLMEITNEIDLTFFYGIHPYFISCKLSEPSADALRELSMYPSYFGGNNSKSALVIVSKINKERSYTYTRANDMGICVIDGTAIKKGKFIDEIKKSLNIKPH